MTESTHSGLEHLARASYPLNRRTGTSMATPSRNLVDIYSGRDPAVLPAYAITHAAWYLDLPRITVRTWVLGQSYQTATGRRRFAPVIRMDDPRAEYISFRNLVEVHVLAALTRKHLVKLPEVRKALRYLEREFVSRHPLAEEHMLIAGKDLFVEKYGSLINVSHEGQIAMKEVLARHLARIDRDPSGAPIRLFPFTTSDRSDTDTPVTINPRIQFGRPCITGTRVPTEEIADRCKAGEKIEELATDFGCSRDQVEAAIRYELRAAA